MTQKYKKIRGKNRRIRHIHRWGKSSMDLDINQLETYDREYVKFWVSPWSQLNMGNSVYPEPDGEYRELLIHYLVQIYQAWHKQLSENYDDFYLQIWLFENELSRSQVVCAVNEMRDFYQNTFGKIDEPHNIQTSRHYRPETAEILDGFDWQVYREIQVYDPNDEIDKEWIAEMPKDKFLRVHENGYNLFEVDRVWLISHNE